MPSANGQRFVAEIKFSSVDVSDPCENWASSSVYLFIKTAITLTPTTVGKRVNSARIGR